MTVRVVLPSPLLAIAGVAGELRLDVAGPVTRATVLDALEARHPMLRGTIRDQITFERRPFIRFFACRKDYSHAAPDDPLPDEIANGTEPFWVVGAIAGG